MARATALIVAGSSICLALGAGTAYAVSTNTSDPSSVIYGCVSRGSVNGRP